MLSIHLYHLEYSYISFHAYTKSYELPHLRKYVGICVTHVCISLSIYVHIHIYICVYAYAYHKHAHMSTYDINLTCCDDT